MGEPHEHMSTPCAYEGVNRVNFHLIAQSFALSLLRQLFESLSFVADSVSFRRSGSTRFCIASRRLDRLESEQSRAVFSALCRSLLAHFRYSITTYVNALGWSPH
jgi:hypothetical protein